MSSDTLPKLSLPSGLKPREADLIVNARVAVDPAVLEVEVKRVVAAQAAKVVEGVLFACGLCEAQFEPLKAGNPYKVLMEFRYIVVKASAALVLGPF